MQDSSDFHDGAGGASSFLDDLAALRLRVSGPEEGRDHRRQTL